MKVVRMRRSTVRGSVVSVVAAVAVALLPFTPGVWAQQDPAQQEALAQEAFGIDEPFAPGEVWVRDWRMHSSTADASGEVLDRSTVAWTDSARVLDHRDGFTIEAALVEFESRRRTGNTLTVRRYGEPELEHILGRYGQKVPFQRSWIYRYRSDWTVEDVTGPTKTASQILAYLAYREDEDPGARSKLERWAESIEARIREFLARVGGSWLADAIEDATNRGLEPVRLTMDRLNDGPIQPGTELLLEPGADNLPKGRVRYLGRSGEVGRFEVSYAALQGARAPDVRYAFAIDTAGRLRAVEVEHRQRKTDQGRERQVDRSFSYAIRSIDRPALTAEEEPEEPRQQEGGVEAQQPEPEEPRGPF